jgi:hypothetical protein
MRPIIALNLAALLLGCGSVKTTIKGRVTWEGNPIETGSISFEPEDRQGPSTGGLIQNGQYEVGSDANVQPGKKVVRIQGSAKTGNQIEAGPPLPPGTMVDEVKPVVPAKYNDKSELIREVEAGKVNEFDFELTR